MGCVSMSMNVDSNYTAFYTTTTSAPDSEWQQIIKRLMSEFGIRSSGSKSLDKQKLHELELRKAEQENSVSNKFLTVTKSEQEKIQAKKKAKKAENESQGHSTTGAEILGCQIYLAIQMKNEQDKRENKIKRENKYQT